MYQGKFAKNNKGKAAPRRSQAPQAPGGQPMPPQQPCGGAQVPPQQACGNQMPRQPYGSNQMPPQGGYRPAPPQNGGQYGQQMPRQPYGSNQMPPQGGYRPVPPQNGAPRQQPYGGRMPQQPYGGRQMPPQMPGCGQRPPMPPRQPMAAPQAKPRKSHTGGLIFYTIFFAGILAFYVFSYGLLGDLQDWLVRYESAQPTRKCQEVFDQYFADPDWAKLYDLSGSTESTYEGRDAFAAYMTERQGDRELSYLETSAGLSKDKKYIVRLGDEKIASFTLIDQNHAEDVTDIPDWQLGEIQLFYEGSGTYYIESAAGCVTTVNGVALDENSIIRQTTIKVGEYLPEGITVPALQTQKVTGLMTVPQVSVTDPDGNALEVTYDEASRTFKTDASKLGGGVTEEQKERALEAIKTYAIFMSQKSGGETKLAEYFQRGTDLFQTVSTMERMWNQTFSSYSLTDESVTDCVRYSDTLFSARVKVNLHLVRTDGTEKVTEIDRSMFFKLNGDKWQCYDMTAVDVNEPVEQVRLTYHSEDGQVISSEMVDTASNQIQCPAVTVPEGKTFGGWMREEFKETGERVLKLTLQPDEAGLSPMPADLMPMELYPLFEDA